MSWGLQKFCITNTVLQGRHLLIVVVLAGQKEEEGSSLRQKEEEETPIPMQLVKRECGMHEATVIAEV